MILESSTADSETAWDQLVTQSFRRSREAQRRWGARPLKERLQGVRAARELLARDSRRLAEASSAPRSRPAAESLSAEVLPLAQACRFLERESERVLRVRHWRRSRYQIHRAPHGVVLIIGPGNFPLFLPGVQTLQALVAGNAVLLKPGFLGSRAAEAWRDLLTQAGIDSDLVIVLPEATAAARAALRRHPDKVIFTGSATVGQEVLGQISEAIIPAVLELSGCDPVIIRPDADLDLAVKALQFGLRLNNGATCIAPHRVFVDHRVATELEGRLEHAFRTGTGTIPRELEPNLGRRLRPLIDDASRRGAHFIAGELTERHIVGPVVLAAVAPESTLLRADIFAPVLSLVTVSNDAEAVARANDCPFALGASIFSRDEEVARRLAMELSAGLVTINDLIIPSADPRVPFGGGKRSGFGVTRGAEGLLAMTRPKVVTVTRNSYRPELQPVTENDEQLFASFLQFVHGRGLRSRLCALLSLFQELKRRKKSPA